MTIKDLFKKIEVKIPKTDVIVQLRDDVTWFEYQESLKKESEDERGVFFLSKMIESWNIKKEDGSPEEINEEVLKLLPREVINPLLDKANEIVVSKSEKKK